MNEIETSKVVIESVQSHKETFRLLWGVIALVGTTLVTTVGALFKMYVDSNNKRAENEKEYLKSLNLFAENIKDLTYTLKESNKLATETLKLINNPIIPKLDSIEKRNN